jgi:hypothetical protein
MALTFVSISKGNSRSLPPGLRWSGRKKVKKKEGKGEALFRFRGPGIAGERNREGKGKAPKRTSEAGSALAISFQSKAL